MSTTQLFAELLVSGAGVVIWLAFLLAWQHQISFQDFISDASIFTLAPIVAITLDYKNPKKPNSPFIQMGF